MSGARLNLVRVDDLITTEGIDETGGYLSFQSDEVELVTPDGEPAAMPLPPVWLDRDIRYQYSNGGAGLSPRRKRHQIALNIDYLGNDMRARLEEWMHDRALVHFNPGFGRNTRIAYRPLTGVGTTYPDGTTTLLDLTGRYALESHGDSTENYLWDHGRQITREFTGTDPRRVMATPGGAGQAMEGGSTNGNRHRPGYPMSALEGNGTGDSGWTKGDTTGEISFTHKASFFPHDDMPDALRVHTTFATSSFRSINCNPQWDSGDGEHHYTFAGSGRASMSIWVKGRLGNYATLHFKQDGGASETIALTDYDCSEWRKFSASVYSSDWSTGLPELEILLHADASGDTVDFLIGPTMVTQLSGSNLSDSPEWGPYNTARGASYMATVASTFHFPYAGSAMCTFWWPKEVNPTGWQGLMMLNSSNLGAMYIYNSGTTLRWDCNSADPVTGTITASPGQICTVIAVWGNPAASDIKLYFNGELVGAGTAVERDSDMTLDVEQLLLGRASGYGVHPFIPLSWRIDERAWTPAEAAQISASHRDPVANLLSVQARGRQYRIMKLPSTARNQQGGAQWTGQLVLEEFEYDSNLADLTTAETY